MIEKLVMDLKAQEIKDTEQKAYCDTELAKNEHDRKTATAAVERFCGLYICVVLAILFFESV